MTWCGTWRACTRAITWGMQGGRAVFQRIETFPKIVIAAVGASAWAGAARMAKVLANAAPDIDRERGLRLDALAWSMQMTLRGGEYRARSSSWPSARNA